MSRRMKQLKAARKSAEVSDAAAVREALKKKWAKGSRCPFCNHIYDTRHSLDVHLSRGCKVALERGVSPHKNGPVDPQRPKLGKMYKNSLLAKVLRDE